MLPYQSRDVGSRMVRDNPNHPNHPLFRALLRAFFPPLQLAVEVLLVGVAEQVVRLLGEEYQRVAGASIGEGAVWDVAVELLPLFKVAARQVR
jgi:hypothetical protein